MTQFVYTCIYDDANKFQADLNEYTDFEYMNAEEDCDNTDEELQYYCY